MKYGYQRVINEPFETVDQKIRETLQERGFGILTEIDVKATLKKKLGVDFQKYRILGACNPPFAHKALTTEQGIGLLLPCNVVLWENADGSTTLAAVDAQRMLGIVEREELEELAEEVNQLLRAAVDAV
jgi:uncharacterized protein (DUF302 family)